MTLSHSSAAADGEPRPAHNAHGAGVSNLVSNHREIAPHG
jgi:hypothetical protein